MRAGDLRQRVTIQQASYTRNAYAERVTNWSTFATVWGAVEALNGRELVEARQVQAEINIRVRIRYRAGITAQMRVTFSGRTLEIVAPPIEHTRRREMWLLCKEVVV